MATKSNTSPNSSAKRAARSKENAEYVLPLGGAGWVVKNSGAKKFTAILDSKREAVKIARSLAKQYGRELVIFGKDGNIQQQISYAL